MFSKVLVPSSLPGRAIVNAIVKGGFQSVVVASRNIESAIDDDACHTLARGRGHHARLARVQREAFIAYDSCDDVRKSLRSSGELGVA
jgi:hypothetical protein